MLHIKIALWHVGVQGRRGCEGASCTGHSEAAEAAARGCPTGCPTHLPSEGRQSTSHPPAAHQVSPKELLSAEYQQVSWRIIWSLPSLPTPMQIGLINSV